MKPRHLGQAGLVLAGGSLAALTATLRWHQHRGATKDEITRPLPGDDLVPAARLDSTHAITIHVPADQVWPWLAQMGYGDRAGTYSYDLDDFLPPEWRTGTPFRSWVLPGLALLIANGIVPTIALVGAARRAPWATLAHVAVGGVLVGWISVQPLVIGFLAPAFQIAYLALGVVIPGLGLAMLRDAPRA